LQSLPASGSIAAVQWYYRDHGYSASFHELTLGAVTAQCWWMYGAGQRRIWCWRIGGRILGNPHDLWDRPTREQISKENDVSDGDEIELPLAKLAAVTALLERSRRRSSGKWKLSAPQRARLQSHVTWALLSGGDLTPSVGVPEREFE
jgi:hypothetical protein